MTIANVNRGKRKRPYKIADFLPRKRNRKSPDELLRQVEMLNKFFGGEDLRDGR